jgi:hypothetical protein
VGCAIMPETWPIGLPCCCGEPGICVITEPGIEPGLVYGMMLLPNGCCGC